MLTKTYGLTHGRKWTNIKGNGKFRLKKMIIKLSKFDRSYSLVALGYIQYHIFILGCFQQSASISVSPTQGYDTNVNIELFCLV